MYESGAKGYLGSLYFLFPSICVSPRNMRDVVALTSAPTVDLRASKTKEILNQKCNNCL